MRTLLHFISWHLFVFPHKYHCRMKTFQLHSPLIVTDPAVNLNTFEQHMVLSERGEPLQICCLSFRSFTVWTHAYCSWVLVYTVSRAGKSIIFFEDVIKENWTSRLALQPSLKTEATNPNQTLLFISPNEVTRIHLCEPSLSEGNPISEQWIFIITKINRVRWSSSCIP